MRHTRRLAREPSLPLLSSPVLSSLLFSSLLFSSLLFSSLLFSSLLFSSLLFSSLLFSSLLFSSLLFSPLLSSPLLSALSPPVFVILLSCLLLFSPFPLLSSSPHPRHHIYFLHSGERRYGLGMQMCILRYHKSFTVLSFPVRISC